MINAISELRVPVIPSTPIAAANALRVENGGDEIAAQLQADYSFVIKAPPPKKKGEFEFTNIADETARRIFEESSKTSNQREIAEHTERVISYILRQQVHAVTNSDVLKRFLREVSLGSSAYELTILMGVVDRAKTNVELQKLAYDKDLVKQFVVGHQHALQAHLNIARVIEDNAGQLANARELMGAYQNILITSTSTLAALSATIRRLGINALPQWKSFLTHAAVADLASPQVGAEKAHLLFVLEELKSFRVLGTMVAFLKKLSQSKITVALDDLLMTSLDFVSQPLATMPTIEKWIAACSHSDQILFLQDYRNFFGSITSDAYKNEQEQQNVKAVLQKRIDHLVYTEEE